MLSAVLALTAVAVADRVEQRLVAPTAPTAPAAAPLASPTPLTSAALPAGEMVLTFADGSAAISTGANESIFELGTSTIGDLDLSGIEPMLAQGDAEVSADWGDVTEWYRAVDDGIEHGYTVDVPVSAGDVLTVTVDVVDGEPTLVDGQNVAIERADGGIVWYRGLFAFDANGTDLPAEMAVVDGDIELRVDTAGAEYPITIDPTITEEQELLASTPEELGYFGSVGAIDEARGRMIVGAGTTATIFELQGGVWTRVQELLPTNPGPPPPGLGNQVVSSVDISGDIAVIGSISFGTVAIYDRDAGGFWELSQTLASGDAGFGAAAGVGDGATVDFIFTGAPTAGANGGIIRGYTRTGGTFVAGLNGLGNADSFQGTSVDVEHLGGDDFSYGWTLTGQLNWVIVRTISWNGLSFDQTDQRVARYFDAGLGVGSGFGGDLDIEGTGFVVAADAASGAFVYDFDGPVARVGSVGTELFPTASLVPSSGTGLLSVARGTETIAVGVPTAAGGAVELFEYSPVTQTWATTGESFQPAGYTPVTGGAYGAFVALSGRVLATGDPLADGAFTDQGRAFTADLASRFIVVDDSGDGADAVVGDGVCDTGAGACTLRAAIQESNALVGANTIAFAIPGGGPIDIDVSMALPAVTDTVTIDGYTQPGASVNTDPVTTTSAVAPIRLLGEGPQFGVVGLDLSASTDSVVRGLTIGRFATAILAGERSVISGNYIGSDGVGVLGGGEGVIVDGVDGVVIGGTAPADRNVISGNGGGIVIQGDADNNVILGNLIGTDASGTASLANGVGILTRASDGADTSTRDGNLIGNGALNGRNTIAGNNGDGIFIGTGTVGIQILANWIGVGFGVDGATLGNNLAGGEGGIVVNGGSDTTIGGIGDDGNLIANNKSGVAVVSGTENRIVGNVIRDNVDRGIVIDGVGANDPDDLDEGANRGQNHPIIDSARIESGNLVIDYSVDTVDIEAYPITVEFFAADSGASGEGERFLRRETVAGPGPTSISFLVGTIVGGDPIVATATDASGNTSTFSPVAVVGGSDALVSANVGERFGSAVAIEGNRMAVSAPNADVRAPLLDVVAPNAGLVYIYERSDVGSPWVLTATIASPSPEFGARFGNAVDLRGNLLAVGEAAREDEGRVWVFRLSGGVWSQLGGWIEAFGDGFGNKFGASIAWTGDNNLAIGAPGAEGGQGRVYLASLSGGEGSSWVVGNPLPTFNSTATLDAGDQLGFAVAFDDSPAGDGRLVAGAPGASRRYSWDIGGPGPYGNPGVAPFDVTWNMGSAVDISGDRVITGGISDQLRVNVNESLPVQSSNTTDLGPVVAAGPLNATVNDYLDIEGQNVAVSRGGGGGQVEIYGINGLLTLENLTAYAPPASPGDLVGWAIELDGSSLIAGAPGTNADAGAVYSTDVAMEESTIFGVVRDPGGEPVVGALVALSSLGLSVLTGVDGSFSFADLPPGEYKVTVVPPAGSSLAIEYYPDSYDLANAIPVSTAAGVSLTIDLNQSGVVSGVVTDEFGNPLEGFDIFVTQFVPNVGWVADGPAGVVSGAGGAYSVEVSPGRWSICITPEFGSGLLGDCVPDGWSFSSLETDGLLVVEGSDITGADLQFTADNRALVNVTLVADDGVTPAAGNVRSFLACTPPGVPVSTSELCSVGTSAVPFQFNPPAPFDQFTVRVPAGTYNVAGGVSPDTGTTIDISDATSLTVADGDRFNCTFTMNGAASCEAVTIRFTGAVDDSWSTPANWNTGVVPGPNDSVVIPAGITARGGQHLQRWCRRCCGTAGNRRGEHAQHHRWCRRLAGDHRSSDGRVDGPLARDAEHRSSLGCGRGQRAVRGRYRCSSGGQRHEPPECHRRR